MFSTSAASSAQGFTNSKCYGANTSDSRSAASAASAAILNTPPNTATNTPTHNSNPDSALHTPRDATAPTPPKQESRTCAATNFIVLIPGSDTPPDQVRQGSPTEPPSRNTESSGAQATPASDTARRQGSYGTATPVVAPFSTTANGGLPVARNLFDGASE